MAQSLVSCPLCSTACFSSISALCLSLVNISSKWLRCTICQEELHGLDKLTIHLLSHLTNNSDFAKLFSGENDSPNSESISEPLNLAKVYCNEPKNVDLCSNSVSLFSNSKNTNNIELEKPNIKIDDEIMIVFKSNQKVLQSSSETVCNTSGLSADLSLSFNNFPQFDESFSGNEELSYNGSENISVESSYNPPATCQYQSESFLHESAKNCSCADCSTSFIKNYPLLETTPSPDKNKKTDVNILIDPNVAVCISKNESSDLNKKTKSSFLSPKGERVLGYRCDVCSLVFPDEHILSLHRQLIHVELSEDPAKANRFKCHLCSKSFVMRGSLMVHIRVAHFGGAVVARLIETKQLENNAVSPDSAQFVCSICNKGFRKEQQLIQHEKLHDGKQCDVCLKTFTTKYFLRKHKRLHTGEMPYSCSICNKSFTFQQSYHKHLLYHSDDKPYTCPECGRAFKELSTLQNHQRIHTGEKPFSCETCGKCFRQRVSYLVHRRIHTGDLPYQCQECGKKFRYKVSERTHKCCTSTTVEAKSDTLNISLKVKPHEHDFKSVENVNPTEAKVNKNNEDIIYQEKSSEDQNMTAGDSLMDNNNIVLDSETTDLLSLVMSPADRLQHLSLTAEDHSPCSDSVHQNIDTEALKELLYDVSDYN